MATGPFPAAAATTSTSTPRAHTRYVPLEGSAKVLLYEKLTSAKLQTRYTRYSSSVLRALTASGKREQLGELGTDASISLAGSTVVVVNPPPLDNGDPTATGDLLRWWNLSTGAHGHLVTREDFAGATPGGWMYERSDGGVGHLVAVSFDGTRTELGEPFPNGVPFGVLPGPDGYLAIAEDPDDFGDGAAIYTPYAHPDRPVTLIPKTSPGEECNGLSSTYAACNLDSDKMTLLPLSGAKPVTTRTCEDIPYVYKSNAVWLPRDGCDEGRLGELSKTGHVTFSTRTYERYDMTVALGKIIVTTKDERELLTLTSATATPKVLLN
ncbi:MAG TPA: hypothetical protein VME70_10790 [Mycobacteriales bacterium]|nr:hypothetical protein [Mycobacteriales bacterium]